MNAEEFVAIKVLPEYRELAPQADAFISYGIPTWRVKRIIAVIKDYLDKAMEFDNS